MEHNILDELIIGRVKPSIYAFTTETIPNYLKVGDTYRPVLQRINEWKKFFPNLKHIFQSVASVDDETYFRDYSIHRFLESERDRVRLGMSDMPKSYYYSNEFFKEATVEDVEDAIEDIKSSYELKDGRYKFFSLSEGRVPVKITYERNQTFEPRPNQQATIELFNEARQKGRTNLLMYAVMRFGKSFTSMCCALEMDAKLVLVVSAKADVKNEWKRTVESHVKFEDYVFLDSDDLMGGVNVLSEKLQQNRVVVFLTLQDLMGEEIKEKHQEIFESQIDLLLIDETHYGARAAEYGQVLNLSKAEVKSELKGTDTAEYYEDNDTLKALDARVRIHLSGTPYRILMGSEFEKEDIIAFYQFSDIMRDQAEWDAEYILSDNVKEWDNPYYGFPQMIRFAFIPNQSTLALYRDLEEMGVNIGLSEVFRPKSLRKDSESNSHKVFVHKKEVLDFLKTIDGKEEDPNVLSFLDLESIQEGKMCRHMVFVLPYRASCDAMDSLISEHKDDFKHLGDYEIINISGVENEAKYKTTEDVRHKICECEENNKKTITLTVNRMLTGSTVKEWDTMLFLKDTSSPQEYDQAIFRLQNQYVVTLVDGEETTRYNMKPQTLLVDFDPNRMFRLQEQRSQIYNANTEQSGNQKLRERIETELSYSPIITIDESGLKRVETADIMDAVREYSANRSVMDEVREIPLDYALLDDETIRNTISRLNPIDASKGIELRPVEGEEEDLDTSVSPTETPRDDGSLDDAPSNQIEGGEESLGKKLATYYVQILFYAFLTDSSVKSLEEIIASIDDSDDNKRIAKHTGLQKSVLKIIQEKSNVFVLRALDYKIENINTLINDKQVDPSKRVEVALTKFSRLSSSEVVTPQWVAHDMVKALNRNEVTSDIRFLDIASKQGEFTRTLIEKYGDAVADNIYAIPTSAVTYEFTRKVYSLLGINTDHVFSEFTTYDLLNEEKTNEIMKMLKDMNFDIVIGNPPYQENIAKTKGNKSLSKQLYPKFMEFAFSLDATDVVLITPSRWFTADGQDNSFPFLRKFLKENNHVKKLISYNGRQLFPDMELGNVAVIVWQKGHEGDVVFEECFDEAKTSQCRPLFERGLEMILPMNAFVPIMRKVVMNKGFNSINAITTGRDVFGIPGREIEKRTSDVMFSGSYKVLCSKERVRYIQPKELKKTSSLIQKYKVFTSKANGGAGLLTDNKSNFIIGKSFVAEPGTVCTDSLIAIGGSDDIVEAQNIQKYLATKFVRFMIGILKVSQNLYQNVYRFVPLQDFTSNSDIDWSLSVKEIDKKLYKKYGLSSEEEKLIEEKIRPMDS